MSGGKENQDPGYFSDEDSSEPENFNAPPTVVHESRSSRTVIMVPRNRDVSRGGNYESLTPEEKLDLEAFTEMFEKASDLYLGFSTRILRAKLDDNAEEEQAVLAEVAVEDEKIKSLIRDKNMGSVFEGVATLKDFIDKIEARLTDIHRKLHGANSNTHVIF